MPETNNIDEVKKCGEVAVLIGKNFGVRAASVALSKLRDKCDDKREKVIQSDV